MPNKPFLNHSKQQIITLFKQLRTLSDVASLLEVTLRNLKRIIYWNKISSYYRTFHVMSKHGKARIIHAPSGDLKRLQYKVKYIFNVIFSAKRSAHGFCTGKSIATNAKEHIKKRYVFNVDLKDFFPSISFGRVRGILMSTRYQLPSTPASIIAHICCLNMALPQGAPTSPIISNMLCAKLDKQLNQLATQNHCTYTRYADDITFSTNRQKFPPSIAAPAQDNETSNISPSHQLSSIIDENYFKINESKVKLHYKEARQIVTGLVVNNKLNIKREELKRIRAQIHIYNKFGSVTTSKGEVDNTEKFAKHFLGKLAFIKMIRGDKDLLYQKLKHDIFRTIGRPSVFLPSLPDKIHAGLFVIDSFDETNDLPCYGTGFLVKGVGIITCHHVVNCNEDKIRIFHPSAPGTKYSTRILQSCPDRDLAILSPPEYYNAHPFEFSIYPVITAGDNVSIAGFPRYMTGNVASITPSIITSTKIMRGVKYITVRDIIYDGNSGGPLFNSQNQIIGVIHKGAGATFEGQLDENLAIAITEIVTLLSKQPID